MAGYLWPLREGSRRERLLAALMILQLLLIWASLYVFSWKLALH